MLIILLSDHARSHDGSGDTKLDSALFVSDIHCAIRLWSGGCCSLNKMKNVQLPFCHLFYLVSGKALEQGRATTGELYS